MLNKYDQYTKVCKIIESCTNGQHIKSAESVARSFMSIYRDRKLGISLRAILNSKRERLSLRTYPEVSIHAPLYWLRASEIPNIPTSPLVTPPKKE